MYLVHMFNQDLALDNLKGWYAVKLNEPIHHPEVSGMFDLFCLVVGGGVFLM